MRIEYYDALSRFFHWVMAVVIIYATIAGFGMHWFEDNIPVHAFLSEVNMSLATIGAVLFVARFVWKYFRIEPVRSYELARHQRSLAKMTHALIYFAMFVVFFSGFLMLEKPYRFFWLFQIPNLITDAAINHFFLVMHRAACIGLTFIVLAHIAAVVTHQLGRKNVLETMLPKHDMI